MNRVEIIETAGVLRGDICATCGRPIGPRGQIFRLRATAPGVDLDRDDRFCSEGCAAVALEEWREEERHAE